FLALFIVHSIIAGFTAVMLFVTVRQQTQLLGVTVALSFAVYPPFIYQCATSPESTIVLLFLLSVFLYQAVVVLQRRTLTAYGLLGAIAGALGMTNPGTLVFAMLGFSFIGLLTYKEPRLCQRLLLAGLFLIATISPWIIRNYLMFNRIL